MHPRPPRTRPHTGAGRGVDRVGHTIPEPMDDPAREVRDELRKWDAAMPRELLHAARLLHVAATKFEAEPVLEKHARSLRTIADSIERIAGSVAAWRVESTD